MKKIFSIVIFILTIGAFGAQAEIREANSMQVALENVRAGDLVVFDIDNTILSPTQTLGSDQWYGYLVEKYKRGGADESSAIDLALRDWIAVQKVTRVNPVERITPQLIRSLQKRGIPLMALTARPGELKTATARQLD